MDSDPDPQETWECIQILENDMDPYESESAALVANYGASIISFCQRNLTPLCDSLP